MRSRISLSLNHDPGDAALKTLYISYFGLTKHLSQSQVIPYLQGLAAAGIGVTVLSFEEAFADPKEESAEIGRVREIMTASNIEWRWLRYHKRPSLPATAYDLTVGSVLAVWLVLRKRIDVVHSRSYVPLPIALLCRWLCRTKLVFDVRGMMAEEYVDAGHWKLGSLPFRITKWFERRAFRNADAVIVLTERIREILQSTSKELRASGAPVHVIPCCVEVERFRQVADRATVRDELGLDDGPVLVYVGSLGTWYMGGEMVKLFRELLRLRPKATFLVLTQSPEAARQFFERQEIPRERYSVRTAKPEDVPRFLSAADFALAFIKPCYSKISSSPTKIGEYLAAGLPFITNRGIGDLDELVERNRVGALVDEFDAGEYKRATEVVLELIGEDATTRERCVELARKQFSMREIGQPGYCTLYQGLEKNRQ